MATNWKIVDGNLPYEDNFVSPVPSLSMTDADAPQFLYRIIDGDLPFRREFHSVPTLNGTSNLMWRIEDGDLPYENLFPEMETVDNTPLIFWNIIDSDLPFRQFPEMHTVDEAPLSFWRIIDGDDPFRLAFPEMPKPPRIEKRYKGKHSKIIIPIYKQTIPVGKVLRSDPPG